MSNTLLIKRTAYNNGGAPTSSDLSYGEWAWSNSNSTMYFGAADTGDGSLNILQLTDMIPDATATVKGKAKFSTNDFSVSAGNVQIKTGGVSGGQIADNAIQTAKIGDDQVTAAKIDDDITLAGNCGVSGDWTVGGNLTVEGTTTTVDSTTVVIEDKNIVLAYSDTADPTTSTGVDGAGITIGANASAPYLTWNISNDNWLFSHKLKVTGGLYDTTVDGGSYTGS